MIGSGGGVVLIRVSPDGNLFARWLAGVVGFGQRPLEGTARRRRLPVGVGVVAPPTHAGGEKGSAAEPCTLTFTVLWVRRPSTKTGDSIEVLIRKPFFCRKLHKVLMLDGDLSSFVDVTTNGLWSLCARRSLSLWQSSSVHLI